MHDRTIRLLLVDDDEDDYVLTRDLLADIPDIRFELDWISDAETALEEMARGRHDLHLIDYSLGRLDGLGLIHAAVARGCTTPMILLTGLGDRTIDIGAMRAGAADFLEKWHLDARLLERSIRYSLQEKEHADDLERRVRERTTELARTNVALEAQIAERIRAEEALRAADRRKDEYLSTLAHELRNPLAPIRNALEIMRLAGNAPATVEASRAMIDRQVKHLVHLIDDLMDVARISRGLIKLKIDAVDVGYVVSTAVESVRPFVNKAGHQLVVVVPEAPMTLMADATRLAQILQNLLHNAAKYTAPGGEIRLSAGREGEDVVFRVKDNGRGVPEDMLEKIFESFTQVSRSGDEVASGLGIGLSLVKTLVELHGGRVDARSDGPGKGSEFTVRIPLTHPDETDDPT
ncbi:hybrid sensor histidine kinase/response regulator [Paludisphaera borealis]|uniref:histidine kinase n=1 Tax=Paludisphaera borealis TaxID=1387353 RepID=A0A1U7CZ93_9BACT|nr:hybrid sensor histidine kinase/response regulator [Paludisphaera borealis]APW64277.1 Alginate biosynthesis sensor protein KinB [Paludisphaera borealis]